MFSEFQIGAESKYSEPDFSSDGWLTVTLELGES
eukprot:Gb_32778 [translate_table: standard]